MTQTKTVESKVMEILKVAPETRFDDMLLFLAYYKLYTYGKVSVMNFQDVFCNYEEMGLPCFESIRRARQRVQSCCPELGRKCCVCDRKPISVNVTVNID
jgi:hypothetical protein